MIILWNHDFWVNNKHNTPREEGIAIFKEGMKQDSINTHKVVKGYDFIGLGAENTYLSGWNKIYGEASRQFIREEMASALKRAPDKPVFVVTHEHAKGTVYGSEGHPVITEMLTPYPNVVHFSGHSHFPLEDERSIHQRDFTALETSSLNYCDLGAGRENAPRPPEGRSCVQFIYMEVFDNRIDFHRMNLQPGIREIKPGKLWSVPLPLVKESFLYTDKRADDRRAPVFAAGAGIEAAPDKAPFTGVKLKFDAAKHDDFVFDYVIDVQERQPDGSWGEASRLRYFSDFYRGLGRMAARPELVINAKHFNGNSEYRITVSAAESFGKTGNSLVTTVKTPERAPVQEKK